MNLSLPSSPRLKGRRGSERGEGRFRQEGVKENECPGPPGKMRSWVSHDEERRNTRMTQINNCSLFSRFFFSLYIILKPTAGQSIGRYVGEEVFNLVIICASHCIYGTRCYVQNCSFFPRIRVRSPRNDLSTLRPGGARPGYKLRNANTN